MEFSFDPGGFLWDLSVPRGMGKLPLKFVPSPTSGDLVDLQVQITGLLAFLVVMQISKPLGDFQEKSI